MGLQSQDVTEGLNDDDDMTEQQQNGFSLLLFLGSGVEGRR